MFLSCGTRQLDLSKPVVMGILNVTPDSFSDGGRFFDVPRAIAHAGDMIAQGATIIDIGGESTRPGAAEVSVAEELRRVIPAIEAVAKAGVLVSVDTSKPEVMRAAVAAGASMINDTRALELPGALEAAAGTDAAVCVMHMQGQPATMQSAPRYDNVVNEVRDYLARRVQACTAAGIARERIVIDPGIGFGKTVQHNIELLARLAEWRDMHVPILIGVSRKSTIGALLKHEVHSGAGHHRDVDERLYGGLALTTAAILSGAHIVRTHDVAATVDAVCIATALRAAGYATTNG